MTGLCTFSDIGERFAMRSIVFLFVIYSESNLNNELSFAMNAK